MHRVVLAAYFVFSLAAAPESSPASELPPILPVFVDPLGAEPLVPIEGPAAGVQAESAAAEPAVVEPAIAPPTTELAPPPVTEAALAPTTESASGPTVESAGEPPVAVAAEAASPAPAVEFPEAAPSVAAGAVAGSFDLVLADLVVEPEGLRPSPLPDRPRWTDAVDAALRWRTGDCKFAYYAVGPRDCSGNVHRDHLVAWAEAWDSGLSYADAERWYLDDDNLWVMPAGENISKSDDDPAEWRPQDSADWCRYARNWIAVKAEWNLTADRAEADALQEMLSTCTGAPLPDPVADTPDADPPPEPVGSSDTAPQPEPADDSSDQPSADPDLDELLQEIRSLPCGEWGDEERALARQAPAGFDWGRRDGDNDGNPCDI